MIFFKGFTQLTHLTLHMFNELADGERYVYDGEDGDNNDDTQTDNLIAHLKGVAPTLGTLQILVYDDPTPYAGLGAEEPFLWQWMKLPATNWETFTDLRHLEIPCGMFLIEGSADAEERY